jgi:hypothetical protein
MVLGGMPMASNDANLTTDFHDRQLAQAKA